MIKQDFPMSARSPVVSAMAALGIALALGCASSVETPHDTSPGNQAEVGDHVRVVTVDGSKKQFTVTRVDKDGLFDEDHYLRFDEITDIEYSNRPDGKTRSNLTVAMTVLGIILVLDALGVGDAD